MKEVVTVVSLKRRKGGRVKERQRWEYNSKTRKTNVIFRVLILGFILAENTQIILLFSVFFINFFCVFENAFLKIVKRTRFHYFRKSKTENGLKTVKRMQP